MPGPNANFKGVRQNPRDQVNGGNRALDLSYNDRAGALKTIGSVLGELTPLGDASAGLNGNLGQMIAFYNDSAATVYCGFGATAAAASTAAAGGGALAVAIPPMHYVIFSLGANNFYKTSATCWAYDINDPSYLG